MKFKFPILAKIAIIGAITSIVASGVSLWINTTNQIQASEKNLDKAIENTLEAIEVNYGYNTTDYESTETQQLENIIANAKEVYDLIKNVVYNPKSESFTEYFVRCKETAAAQALEKGAMNKFPWFYPDPDSGASISYPYLVFKGIYTQLIGLLGIGQYSSGARAVYATFIADNGDLVFFGDSRYNQYKSVPFFHITGSHYSIKSTDHVVDGGSEHYDQYLIDGYLTKAVDIKRFDETGTEVILARFFVEYDYVAINQENQKEFTRNLIIFIVTSAVVILTIILASYFMFSRNINKLKKGAQNISSQLSNNQDFNVIDININSHDEMKTLSDTFVEMENQLVNYIDIIKKDAATREKTLAELEVASRIQLEALPNTSFVDQNINIKAFIKTAKEVGGDFYDYFYAGDKLVLIISDVSGKGIPASLFMMRSKALIKSKLFSGLSIKDALYDANNELVKGNKENLFVTSFVGEIDFKKHVIKYVNAGHEKPYIISKGKISRLEGKSNFVLGGIDNFVFEEEAHPFNEGDSIFLFTDGLNESINDKEEEFGYKRIAETLEESMDYSLEDKIKYMNIKLLEFVGDKEQFDDISMIFANAVSSELHLHYEEKDYSIIEDAANAFSSQFPSISPKIKSKVGIILDEILNNRISYEAIENLVIDIEFKFKENKLLMVISDNGSDYNLIEKGEDKYATESENLELGGFGIMLIKEFADKLTYEYKNNKSIISITLIDKENLN